MFGNSLAESFRFGQNVSKIFNHYYNRNKLTDVEELEILLDQKCAQLDAALDIIKELRDSVGLGGDTYRKQILDPRYQQLTRHYSEKRGVPSPI